MFKDYILNILGAKYESKIFIFDIDDIEDRYSYCSLLDNLGFQIINYENVIDFRYIFESRIKNNNDKFAVVINREHYVPYDIFKSFYCVEISWEKLFPNLNREVLHNNKDLEIPLLYSAYDKLYENLTIYEKSISYIDEKVYGKENVLSYLKELEEEISTLLLSDNLDYTNWTHIASRKGKAEYLAAKSGIGVDFSFIDEGFKQFVLDQYKNLSSVVHKGSPVMVTRVMDFITKSKEKVALIILDGMSVFDFNILSKEFEGIDYTEDYIYALIPTTTAVSRQSLLSGKFPLQLEKPFNLSREEREFKLKAESLGYLKNQILYTRGYNPNIGPNIKCLSIILNDIDDLVHGQRQGRIGMYNDIQYLAKLGEIQKLIKSLFKMGFDIYLTSDHGNTLCRGLGSIQNTGVEVETKSKRMLILKDFANKDEIIHQYNLVEYPGYYLDKQFDFLICDTGTSFDNKNSTVMTHGGISIDEVIVPFIKVKAVHYG